MQKLIRKLFYENFNSLTIRPFSTIGLGDITPTEPRYLLMLFFYILIGLSLISMLLNLIQSRLERRYDKGIFFCSSSNLINNKNNTSTCATRCSENLINNNSHYVSTSRLKRRHAGSSLGIFRGFSHVGSSSLAHDTRGITPLTRDNLQEVWRNRVTQNKTSQTWLSFPLANKTSNARIAKTVSKTAVSFFMFNKGIYNNA